MPTRCACCKSGLRACPSQTESGRAQISPTTYRVLPNAVSDDVTTIVRRFPELAEPTSVTPLSGGITNRNYRVEVGGAVYVLRIAGRNTAQLGIDRDREHHCALMAAALGVGAEVIRYLPEHGATLTRFIAGRVLSPDLAAHNEILARAADALRRLHAGPTVPGTFSAFEVVDDYHRLAARHGVALPAEMTRALSELETLRKSLGAREPSCPCHNDLLPGNLIDDGASIRIIDWEYGGMGDPYFDLGNFAENHRLAPDRERDLLRLYLGFVRPKDQTRLRAMRRVSSLREAMWGFAQVGISELEFDFAGYAKRHFQRFLAPDDA